MGTGHLLVRQLAADAAEGEGLLVIDDPDAVGARLEPCRRGMATAPSTSARCPRSRRTLLLSSAAIRPVAAAAKQYLGRRPSSGDCATAMAFAAAA